MNRETHVVNGYDFELVHCPPGKFMMGSPETDTDRDDDEWLHQVTITRAFALGVVPVTQAFFTLVTNPSDYLYSHAQYRPAVNVSWFDAIRFCNNLSRRVNLECAYSIGRGSESVSARNSEQPIVICDFSASGFRLPTEAEWEYAARSGGDSFYYAGSNVLEDVAWFPQKSWMLMRVAGKSATRWGIYDLSGNVWEWCWDRGGDYIVDQLVDPTGRLDKPTRVARGGGVYENRVYQTWNDSIDDTRELAAQRHRVAYRGWEQPGARWDMIGFRLARTV